MKKEKMEKLEKLLVVVDMVNGFVKEGNMADPKIAHIIPEQVRLIEDFINDDEGIAFIKDNHEPECAEFSKFPAHCVIGTSEADLVDELKDYEKYGYVYPKNSTSAMFAPNFMENINRMKLLKEVVIVGCCTDICITNLAIPLVNYFDQDNRKVDVTIPMNAVETYDAPWHERDEYNELAFKMLKQAGVQLVKKYERGNNNGK